MVLLSSHGLITGNVWHVFPEEGEKIQCVRVKFALTDGLFCVLKVMTVE